MNTKLIILMESLRSFIKREDGASAIEYALIAGLMAVIVIAAMAMLGGEDGALTGIFEAISGKLSEAATSVNGADGG